MSEPEVIEIDPNSESDSENRMPLGSDNRVEDEPLPKKSKRLYILQQKKRVVALAKSKFVTAAVEHFKIPRTTINRWMKDGYFEHERTKGGHRSVSRVAHV